MEIAKLESSREVSILVYGLKPFYEEEIRAELSELDGPSLEILAPGRTLEL